MNIICNSCNFSNKFKQKFLYHAGFSNLGFLYNEEGNLTLTWSSYDSSYTNVVGEIHPWMLSNKQKDKLESVLKPAPHGGKWSFANVPRCSKCHEPIGKSISETIYFIVFPNSLELDKDNLLKQTIK